jgi:cell fate regulator YaaT (PSP1 superfamily)
MDEHKKRKEKKRKEKKFWMWTQQSFNEVRLYMTLIDDDFNLDAMEASSLKQNRLT